MPLPDSLGEGAEPQRGQRSSHSFTKSEISLHVHSLYQWGRRSVLVSEVSSFQCMQEWYLGWEKVSCLERCPQVPLYYVLVSVCVVCGVYI